MCRLRNSILILFTALTLIGCTEVLESMGFQFEEESAPQPNRLSQPVSVLQVKSPLLGSAINQPLQASDVQNAYQALHRQKGDEYTWKNEETGVEFTVITLSNWQRYQDYSHCRRFRTKVFYAGKRQNFIGFACMNLNGEWEYIS